MLRLVPPVDEQITSILMRSGLFAATPAAVRTTAEILRVIEDEQLRACADEDCVIRQSHSRLGPHLWKHEACPPFTRRMFSWRCFTCNRRQGHRIHQVRETG
jgi:hypothetical protein